MRQCRQRNLVFRAVLCALWIGVSVGARAQELPAGFALDVLATNLNAATAIAPLPDGRILIAEQTGRILVWRPGGLLPDPALALHVTDYWERGLIGLTVAPGFPSPPHVYVCYVTDRPATNHVLSRFTMTGDTIDPASEFVLLRGDDQEAFGGFKKAGHQGGTLRFGPDGKLYASIGEQTARTPSQDFGALQGSILRLDPDGSIPGDNPFVDRARGKYRAIFAMGVRNCYGIAFQPDGDGGMAFFTDVGESRFEEINALVPGGNYGWPEFEGPSDDPRFIAPVHAYPPAVGRSICGGLFYPKHPPYGGASFPVKWRGQFFFADWANHWIRALDPERPDRSVMFAAGFNAPVAIELRGDGSMLVLNRGTIWRDGSKFQKNSGSLVRIRYTGIDAPGLVDERVGPAALGLPGLYRQLPGRLSKLALFPALRARLERAPESGRSAAAWPGRVREYGLNCPPWLPRVDVRRWIALPEGRAIRFTPSGDWILPPGAVLMQHISRSVDGDAGHPLETRFLETRFLVVGDPAGYGVSYRWTEDGADAERVEDLDAMALGDGLYWPLPAPEPSLRLPSSSLAFVPDLSTRQLNRPGPDNPVREWARDGWLAGVPNDAVMGALKPMVPHGAVEASLEARVRSYLDVNCSMCHRPGGSARGRFDARFETRIGEAGLMDGALEAGDLGVTGARVIVAGDPGRSILFRRLANDDFFRMPPVRYHNLESPILSVLEEWIRSMGREGDR